MSYLNWPFQPFHQHSVETVEQWWQYCHLAGAGEQLLLDSPHWAIIDGDPGSGKSVALAALRRRTATVAFHVAYPPSRWPGAPQALLRDESSHLAQMMACAGLTLRDYLQTKPEQAALLSSLQREFLRWLLQRYLGGRAYHVMTHRLPHELAEAFRAVVFEDLFPTLENPLDVQGQIDELVCLVETLGFKRLLFLVDIDTPDKSSNLISGLPDLFGWLELMHHPGFVLVAAVPTSILQESQSELRARHRVRHVSLSWTVEQCRQIAIKHIAQALGQLEVNLADYIEERLIEEVTIVIEREYGASVPGAWVALAETILHLTHHKIMPTPLKLSDLLQLQHAYYARHFPLRLDIERLGVWRGPRFLHLDQRPFDFLTLLFQRRGTPANYEDSDVRLTVGSANNMHSMASRLRKVIEPVSDFQPVYLINKRGIGGYWIENYTGL
jgi:hypothetical protein